MDSNLRRELIIDNASNPYHKKEITTKDFIKANTNNESCIDNVDLYVKVEDGKISDAYFSGEACAITTSATSLMIQKIIGMKINEARNLISEYYKMIKEEDYHEELLGELNAYQDISKQPSRTKCAILPFQTLEKTIKIYEETKN